MIGLLIKVFKHKYDGGIDMAEDNVNFITIELSKKQVDMNHLYHNDKTNKDYARVMAPGNGTFFYPISSIKVKKDNPNRVYFTRPEGTEIQVIYSKRKENIPDSASNDEKYERHTRTWKMEELKAAYDEEKKEYAENHGFVNYTVPTSWGRKFSSNGVDYISISVPVPVENSDKDRWCSLVIGAERFKKSDRDENMSYFGFPKKKKDTTEDYMVELRYGEKQSDGSYSNEKMFLSSAALKECIEKAVKRSLAKDLFVSTEISDKLLRPFETKEGKKLYAVSVPVYENNNEKATFYEIVVPEERVSINPETNRARLSLFKNSPDGQIYNHTAKRSFDNGNGGYDTVSKTYSSEEIIKFFEESKEKYKEKHSDSDYSLADEDEASGLSAGSSVNENIEQNVNHRHR